MKRSVSLFLALIVIALLIPFASISVSAATHAGTKADPYTAADANSVGSKLATNAFTSSAVYVKGIVSSFEDAGNYVKNLKLVDKKGDTATFLCYTVNKTTSVSSIKVGDTVVVYGYIKNYNGTAEIATKNDGGTSIYAEFISSDNAGTGGDPVVPPVSGDPAHKGTKADPYSAADANIVGGKLASGAFTSTAVYVKGIVSSFDDSGDYVKNLKLVDKKGDTASFLCYTVNKTTAVSEIKVGDTVVVYGFIKNYSGTAEMATKTDGDTKTYAEFISSDNGGTGGQDDPPISGDTTHAGTKADPYSVADAIIAASALGEKEYSKDRVYVKGIIDTCSDVGSYVQNIHLIDKEGDKVFFTVYSANETDTCKDPQVGDTVVIYGYLVNWYGTPEMSNQKFSETENVYPELVKTIDITDKTLEERLIEKVGEKNANGKFDVIVEAPETFEKGKEIEVSVTVKNITVTEGLSQLDFVFNYDNKNLVITNALGDDKALNCVDKLPSENWDNLSRIKFDEKGIVNTGKVEVGVLNASDNVSAKKDGDVTFKFTFTVNDDAEDEIGFYIANASVSGYDWTNTETIYVGNGSYAITKVAEEEKILIGDVNLDGVINSRDYALLKRHCLGTYKLEGDGLKAGDINGDNAVNARDYGLLKRACLGTYTIEQ